MDNFQDSLPLAIGRSPLNHAQHGSLERVLLREIPFVTTHELRVKPGTLDYSAVIETLNLDLPILVGSTYIKRDERQNSIVSLCMGPDYWLLLGAFKAMQTLEPLHSQFHFSIVEVSAQRTSIEIKGPHARNLLEHVWEQDLREKAFRLGACTQGLMAKAPTVLWHRSQNDYHLCVRSSFANHLWSVLVDAATEYIA